MNKKTYKVGWCHASGKRGSYGEYTKEEAEKIVDSMNRMHNGYPIKYFLTN